MNNKPIHELLNMSAEDYEKMTLNAWLDWAEEHSLNYKHWRNIISSRPVNKWFLTEYAKLEGEFLSMVRLYQDADHSIMIDLQRIYAECIVAIECMYPKSLLEKLRPKEAIKIERGNKATLKKGRSLVVWQDVMSN